ncbi:uncharacterized protein LOC133640959 [Entelurus aequoreus]|uniref:uncharacterized protein LOC133640959 n=1 Tax=Entelurus aequoreus TaxID=161455 RepID=UPI002B1E6566|nr:uncharacterized protein LOC133640959 [Entelurus aequoreus]
MSSRVQTSCFAPRKNNPRQGPSRDRCRQQSVFQQATWRMEEGRWEALGAMGDRDLMWGPNGKLIPISSIWSEDGAASPQSRKRRSRQRTSGKVSGQNAARLQAPPPPGGNGPQPARLPQDDITAKDFFSLNSLTFDHLPSTKDSVSMIKHYQNMILDIRASPSQSPRFHAPPPRTQATPKSQKNFFSPTQSQVQKERHFGQFIGEEFTPLLTSLHPPQKTVPDSGERVWYPLLEGGARAGNFSGGVAQHHHAEPQPPARPPPPVFRPAKPQPPTRPPPPVFRPAKPQPPARPPPPKPQLAPVSAPSPRLAPVLPDVKLVPKKV